jgi:L-rhamnose mutarotase
MNMKNQRQAFTMQLMKGQEEEYKKRHDAIWPELRKLLKSSGISNYSIFLDEATGVLFAYLEVEDAQRADDNRHEPIMKEWWKYMKDIMDTEPDNSPSATPLKEVFHMP